MKNTSKFLVSGGKPLHGNIKISGAKNSASKLLIASLLTDQPVHITNCPISIGEILVAKQLCQLLGAKFKKFSDNEVMIQTTNLTSFTFSVELGLINRLGILTVGPQLHRAGEAEIPKPGGDKIGARPIDFHLDALKQLGAEVKENKSYYSLKSA